MMKKVLSGLLCLVMVGASMTVSATSANKLFDIDPDSVERIEIRMGGGATHETNAAQDSERIHEIIRTLNDFVYEETVDTSGTVGWYAELLVTDKDGTEQTIEISPNGAHAPNSSDNIRYYNPDCEYFGEDWLKLLFPYPLMDVKMWESFDIKGLYDMGLMYGTTKTTFSPDAVMTRGMFVTVLARMAGVNESDYREDRFEDVNTTDYFYSYISWAYQNGIVKGNAQRKFSPNDPVTREQAALMLARYAEALNLDFLTSDITYRPGFAEIQERLTDIQDTSAEFQEKYPPLYAANIIGGIDGTPIFDPEGHLTRQEAARALASAYGQLYLY